MAAASRESKCRGGSRLVVAVVEAEHRLPRPFRGAGRGSSAGLRRVDGGRGRRWSSLALLTVGGGRRLRLLEPAHGLAADRRRCVDARTRAGRSHGVAITVMRVVIVVVVLVAAFRLRRSPGLVLVAGILGSLIAVPIPACIRPLLACCRCCDRLGRAADPGVARAARGRLAAHRRPSSAWLGARTAAAEVAAGRARLPGRHMRDRVARQAVAPAR